jgi:ATP/maltotriose-dependent transcriptional regulator MalT
MSRTSDALHDLHLNAALICLRDGRPTKAARHIRVAQDHDRIEDGLVVAALLIVSRVQQIARGLCVALERRLAGAGTPRRAAGEKR